MFILYEKLREGNTFVGDPEFTFFTLNAKVYSFLIGINDVYSSEK